MTTKLALGIDTNHEVTFELPISDTVANATLTANTALSLTIPANMTRAFFSFSNGTDVYVRYDGSAATLPGGSFTISRQELNPVARYGITPGNTLSFISPTTAYVSVSFFTDNINGY